MPWVNRGSMAVTRGFVGPQLPELNGLLWAAGGQFGGSAANNRTNTDSYDPATGTWTARAVMPQGLRAHALAAAGGYLWCFGGLDTASTASNKIHRYDPAANTWSLLAGHALLPNTFFSLSAAPTGDGRIILWGGTEAAGAVGRRIHRFDPATLITTLLVTVTPSSDADLGWGANPGGDVRAGILYWAHSDKLIAYDITANTFATKAAPPYVVLNSCLVAHNAQLILLGGGSNATDRVKHTAYDPVSNTWTAKTAIPTQRSLAPAGVATLTNSIIITGGTSNGSTTTWLATTHEWQPPIVDLPAIDLTLSLEVSTYADVEDVELETVIEVEADTDKRYGRVPVAGIVSGRAQPALPVDDIYPDADLWPEM